MKNYIKFLKEEYVLHSFLYNLLIIDSVKYLDKLDETTILSRYS